MEPASRLKWTVLEGPSNSARNRAPEAPVADRKAKPKLIQKVSICRRWRGAIPTRRDGTPIPRMMWPKRRPCAWLVRWFSPSADGRTVRPSRRFQTKEAAEEFATKLQAEFDSAPSARRELRKLSLDQFIDEYLALGVGPSGQKLKPRTRQQARLALRHFAKVVGGDRPLSGITPQIVARYFSALRAKGGRGSGPSTVNCRLRMLRSAFGVAVSPMELLKANPLRGFKADRTTDGEIRYIDHGEFGALLRAADDESNSVWWKSLLLLAYSGGLRFAELLNLTWADIDFEAAVVRVTPKAETKTTIAWTPKDYERRTIPIPPETLAELAKLQAAAEDGQVYVFVPPSRIEFIKAAQAAGTWSDARYILNNFHRRFPIVIKRAAEHAPSLLNGEGKPTMSLHDLRRTAITNWTKTANIQTVARLAGHSDTTTTLRFYASVTADQIEAVRAANAAALAQVLADE